MPRFTGMQSVRRQAFTLIELMAVIVIILIMLGGATVMFMNGRQSVKIRSDANHLVSFMRSMLDYTKATGVPLVIQFDSKDESFSYVDPRTREIKKAKLESKAKVMAIKLNERLYTPENLSSEVESQDGETNPDEYSAELSFDSSFEDEETSVYVSEGRGLINMSMLLAVRAEDGEITDAILSRLNLISGKGGIFLLKPEEVQQFFDQAEEESVVEP